MADNPLGLSERFEACAEACESLSAGKAVADTLVSELQACSRMVDALSLFSDNENLDDITTASLKYGFRVATLPASPSSLDMLLSNKADN